jgi:hypothetical protein
MVKIEDVLDETDTVHLMCDTLQWDAAHVAPLAVERHFCHPGISR